MADILYYVYLVLIFLVNYVINEDIKISFEKSELHPAITDFSRHTLVKPRIYHGREKRQISSTKNKETNGHVDHLKIALELDGEDVLLDLTLNKQLIPEGYFYRYQENGKQRVHKPKAQEVDLCHYNGKVRGKKDSWVALSTCNGLSGVIFDGNEMHYIEHNNAKILDSNLNVPHFIYKHSNLIATENKTCGYSNAIHEHIHNNGNRILRYKRSIEGNELVRGPYNAKKDSKYVELVLVVDNREYKELGENMNRVKQHCKSIANIINSLYASLNIFIALVGVVVWTEHDEISFSPNGDQTLTNFLHYRRGKLIKEHPNDNAQLLTKYTFDNGVVGKALKGPICTYEYSGGVNSDHSPVVGLVATTVAHEMGHNFGMEHDTNECTCPDDRCIMAPSSSTIAPKHWSSCSKEYLVAAFGHGMDYCLKNKPKALFDSPVCGNGFVEPGEQCDCGLPDHCDNTCCNASTCMLHSNASCATGECCDLTTCMPKNAGTLCRSAEYECDLPEYCTGQSEYCPTDIYKMDTEVCENGKAYCYHGFCRTRTDQCKLLWGETGKSSDEQCYEMNKKGTRHGNCGYNKVNQSFFKCDNENILCGMLHCKHLNERLEFGMESVAILSHSFINKKGSIIPCRTALVDLGINQVDPGLAPDGAKCGDGKMCVNQKCMAVDSLRRIGPKCPHDCNGNGWCNSLGHCHCKDGFAPPFCDYPGPGGSEDSGPAADPNARQGFVSAMYIIFLGIVPLMAIISLLFYYGKRNIRLTWNKPPPATSKSPSKSRGVPFSSESTKRTEDNHSLLHEEPPTPTGLQNEFFGHFKGYTLEPLKKPEPEPLRSAPPPPTVPAPAAAAPKASPPPAAPVAPKSPVNYTKPPPPVPTATIKPNLSWSNSVITPKMNFLTKPVQKYNSFRNNSLSSGLSQTNNTSVAPALPPPNPGSNARPIISSPVLENSTCTAKELLSPLRNAPKAPFRTAPEAPPLESTESKNVRPVSTVEITEKPSTDTKKPKENTTLNRIASFLKPQDKKPVVHTNSLSRPNQVKANKILDKNALRNIEISNPIPQTEIEIAVVPVSNASTSNSNNTETPKAVVMRAQSMRDPKTTARPNIQTFGSMRQPSGVKRPVSIPSGSRPKSPPPPRPPPPPKNDDKPKQSASKPNQNQYDDCMNKAAPLARLSEEISPTSSDNIYAVIEDSPSSPDKSLEDKVKSSSGSSESMGLLGEIVSEIQNRNFDSIYSTSTLNRKKQEKLNEAKNAAENSETYVNTSSIYKSPESEYTNLKSSASSTSSGYIHPSAVNVPVNQPEKKVEEKPAPALSSFKSDKPFTSTFSRPPGPLAAASKDTTSKKPELSRTRTPPSPINKTPKTINRQTTPPNLRTRKQSPSRTASSPTNRTNRSVTNSPDLVTSCNSNPSTKPPDVLNTAVKKPAIASVKPTISNPKVPTKVKSNSFKSNVDSSSSSNKKGPGDKPPVATKLNKTSSDTNGLKQTSVGLRSAAKQSSNVASLQQKFENKNHLTDISKNNGGATITKVNA